MSQNIMQDTTLPSRNLFHKCVNREWQLYEEDCENAICFPDNDADEFRISLKRPLFPALHAELKLHAMQKV